LASALMPSLLPELPWNPHRSPAVAERKGQPPHRHRRNPRPDGQELESLLAAPCLDPGLANGQTLEACARIAAESCRGDESNRNRLVCKYQLRIVLKLNYEN
jgi:hypothetical protein